jgi:hypothetical protein
LALDFLESESRKQQGYLHVGIGAPLAENAMPFKLPS